MAHPLSCLPPPVVDHILHQLGPASLAVCSLVCQAWKDLPYDFLPGRLLIQAGPLATGILNAGLHRCKHLHTICVTSSKDPIWPRFATALAQQRLPALRELHIQHSSQTDATHLEQLRSILQVQGGQCCLHLALTDKASLQALVPLLPLHGLISLELNVPYLAQGALQLLLHAATVQAAAMASTSTSRPSTSATSLQQQQEQQKVLRVGLWVCCWGGCPGLLLSEASALHSKLQRVPHCRMTCCESINITRMTDLAALSHLQGLEALGINFTSNTPPAEASPAEPLLGPTGDAVLSGTAGVTQDAAAGGSAHVGNDSNSGNADAAGLASLAMLSSTLKQLSIRGSPPGGWQGAPLAASQDQEVQHMQEQQAQFLSPLTGLTKLSVLKDWAQPALAVQPIAGLLLLQELALERQGLQHPQELCCLSALSALKVLSLVLTVTADEVVEAVQTGRSQLAGQSAHHQQQQVQQEQQCERVAQQLNMLHMVDRTGSIESGWQSTNQHRCCCSLQVPEADLSTGAVPAQGAAGAQCLLQGAHPGELLQQVQGCPVLGGAGSPELLDWSWLRGLQQLEVAWLQVPHLELSCLPSSLCELDAQQPRDLTRVSITCNTSSGLNLPRLQRLVLPHLLQAQHRHALTRLLDQLPQDQEDLRDSCCSSETSDSDDSSELQLHYEAALLLSVVAGCPDLKELELVQWQPPEAAVLAAAGHLRFLKLLSVVAPEGVRDDVLRGRVGAVRGQSGMQPVDLQLQEPLVLTSYPWSSVLAVR